MFPFPCRKGCTDKANPENKIPNKRISPGQTSGKNIPEDDLQEGDEDHGTQEDDEEDLFYSINDFIGSFPSIHHFTPLR
jgi:hypothetical protein